MKKEYSVAVIGATGNIGRKILEILEERDFPVENVFAIASEKSVGKEISFKSKILKVVRFADVDFSKIDIAFFCAGSTVSRKYAGQVAEKGCVIIDKTSYFRLNPKVPLIIPEVNENVLDKGASLGIISTPNCVAVPLAMTLKALSTISSIKRAVISTYQSVSGAGHQAVHELISQTKNMLSVQEMSIDVFQKQIAFNVIPAIGDIMSSGFSDEEEKIAFEVCKILKSDVKIAVTCVRVPVFIGHCMSVACEFTKPISENDAFDAFENFDGIVTIDRREDAVFVSPIDTEGENAVYISRVRRDLSVKNGLMYWAATDNLRKGAALNGVQIAELLIKKDPQLGLFKKQNKD